MIVSHKFQFIFVSNPKAASSSIQQALADFHEEPQLDEIARINFYTKYHMPAILLKEHLPQDVWCNYYKFTFVRNPWDWFVSQHFYNLEKRGKLDRKKERLLSVDDIMDTYSHMKRYKGVDRVDSAFQCSFVCDNKGRSLVDFLGRYECLKEHFQIVQKKIGIQVELPHLNESKHYYYKKYYNDETKSLVGRLYECDVHIFDYKY